MATPLLTATLVLLPSACGDDDDLLVPELGDLEVALTTTGSAVDDGCLVAVDAGTTVPIEANGTVVSDGLAGGSHTVTLSGVDEVCVLAGESSVLLEVHVEQTAVASAELSVDCPAG